MIGPTRFIFSELKILLKIFASNIESVKNSCVASLCALIGDLFR